MRRADFIEPPATFLRHAPGRQFIGPGTVRLAGGDVLMVAPWGRPPADFSELAGGAPLPMRYRSGDGGRTWREAGRLSMDWRVGGFISDGGITLLPLRDGRLAGLFHRHVPGLKGGGTPAIAFSGDDGETWTPARTLDAEDEPLYVMNDRMIQTASGRLVVPVSRAVGAGEGDRDESLCYFSDDAGETWARSAQPVEPPPGPRGMAEPCAVELRDGRLMILARTGTGFHHRAHSDDGGDTWSPAEPTALAAACSPLTLKRMPDGRLIVAYNPATPLAPGGFFPRSPLACAVSEDDGRSWDDPLLIDGEGAADSSRSHGYPSICFLDDGVLLVYSTHFCNNVFGGKTPEQLMIGGGRRCVIKYPA